MDLTAADFHLSLCWARIRSLTFGLGPIGMVEEKLDWTELMLKASRQLWKVNDNRTWPGELQVSLWETRKGTNCYDDFGNDEMKPEKSDILQCFHFWDYHNTVRVKIWVKPPLNVTSLQYKPLKIATKFRITASSSSILII